MFYFIELVWFLSFLTLINSKPTNLHQFTSGITVPHLRTTELGHLDEINRCHNLWDQSDPCHYATLHCSDLTEGLVDYLDLYYCKLEPNVGSIIGGGILSIVLGLVFLFLGTIASDFFCPNLAALSEHFALSENVAGVTLLAFGNGSPDLFSTFSALKAGSGALAVGEMIGASWFIISVVVGSMAIISSFRVVKRFFLRDLFFFTGAMVFMIFILWDQQLTPIEASFLIGYYVIYVVVVVFFKPSEVEVLDESTHLIPERALSHQERISISAPSTYYKRMNFWTQDEISRAFKLGTGDLHPGSSYLFRRKSQFLPASAKLSNQFRQRKRSLPEIARRYCPDSPDTTSESPPSPTNDDLLQDQLLHRAQSPIVPKLTIHTGSQEELSLYSSPTSESPLDLTPTIESGDGGSLMKILFPVIYEWNELSYYEQLLNIMCTPFIFILTLTVPLPVDPQEDVESDLPTSPSEMVDKDHHDRFNPGWILLSFQMFIIPIFLSEVVLIDHHLITHYGVYGAAVVGLISVTLVNFLYPDRLDQEEWVFKYAFVISFIGFVQALCWISLAATEVVDLLRAVGIILGINEEIIGLTVFAMGNSLGDFVANLSVARMGYPTMAVSACFAGPMLNLMLGPGLSGLYLGLTRGDPLPLPTTSIMTLASSGALVTLVTYLIYVHLNRYYIGRKFGLLLVSLYIIGMATSVLVTE